ncbi:MAG: hypothetical protein MK004_18080 [Planctomycetales bacterium]|nr:hypothetical protein [Planctomycetales bacterium]
MRLTSWIDSLRNRLASPGSHRRRQSAPRNVEALEDRTLLSVTSLFVNGLLSVTATSGESIRITTDTTLNAVVEVDGEIDTNLPQVLAGDVEQIEVIGGDGDNVIDLTDVRSAIFNHTDPVTGDPMPISINGSDGQDTIDGSTDLDDVILGGDGDDVIQAGTGDNHIDGGDGNDNLSGGAGNDNLVGEDGRDTLRGENGSDTLSGGNGRDSLMGDNGNDSIDGGHGHDTLEGGNDNDSLNGGDGHDSVSGGPGDDSLTGGIQSDTLIGGTGDDTALGNTGADHLEGGTGDDLLVGGHDSDTLLGEMGNDKLNGQRDNDSLDAGLGDDTIFGGHGNDTATGNGGDDTINGQGGNDWLVDDTGDDLINGGTGRDLIDSRGTYVTIDDVQLAAEGNTGDTSVMTFTVSLVGNTSSDFTIDFATSDETASAGSDYVATSGQLTFAPGDASKTIDVTVNGDTLSENHETFAVTLSNSGNVILFDATGQGTIVDDDQIAGLDFQGFTQGPGGPPDPTAAAGPNNLVGMVNFDIGIWNKNGTVVEIQTLDDFFEEVDQDYGPFDPWATYAQYSDRYIVLAEEVESGTVNQDGSGGSTKGGYGATQANLLIGISTDDTPDDLDVTAGDNDWHVYSIPATHDFGAGLAWIDYPKITADADSIYITGNYFAFGDRAFQGTRVTRLDKAPMLDGTLGTRTDVVTGFTGTLQPALSVNRSAADPQLFVEASAGSVNVWEMDDSNSLTIAQTFPSAYNPLPGNFGVPQQGTSSTLDSVPNRMMNAVWRDDSLWATHTVNVGGAANARWYEIDTTNSNYTLTQTGNVDAGPGIHTFMPGVSVDSEGNMGIVYSQSSTTQFPAMMYAGRQIADPLGTTREGTVVKASTTFYEGIPGRSPNQYRWGDYAGIAIDPADSKTFWGLHEYSASNSAWGTWWSSFRFANDTPPPPPPSSSPSLPSSGTDTLRGGNGNDTIFAGVSNDLIYGGTAKDSIDGGLGDDTIRGEGGRDTINGGDGNDEIRGNQGNDVLNGGGGDDHLIWSPGEANDTTSGGEGFDTLQIHGSSLADDYSITKTAGGTARTQITDGSHTVTLGSSIEIASLLMGDGDDTVTINDVKGVPGTLMAVYGENGNDTISADESRVGTVRLLLDGGDGNDTLTGSIGNDTLLGGDGDDSMHAGDGHDTLEAGLGDDVVHGGLGGDVLRGDEGNDTLEGNTGNDSLVGGAGNDSLTGGYDDDSIVGAEGDDVINGQRGNDFLLGGAGADTIRGGSGDDYLDGGLNDDRILANDGNDTIRGDDGDDEIHGHDGDDLIGGGDGNDVITGSSGSDLINGGDGDDSVNAGGGDDIVEGHDGNDTLFGGSGSDVILGEDGNDRAFGQGSANDTLSGGEGSDELNGLASEIDEAFSLETSVFALLNSV